MSETKQLTWSEFVQQFKPRRNHLSPNPEEYMFETFGAELEFVADFEEIFVWTYVDHGEFSVTIEGMQVKNRVGYFVTEQPWTEGTSYEIDMDDVPESCSGCGEDETPDGETLMVSYGCDIRKQYCLNCCNCPEHKDTEWY